MIERDQLTALQAENARLIALLDGHGIEWRLPSEPTTPELAPPVLEPEPSRLSTAEKVALFRRLFRGRTDVYPLRWESKTTGKSGYTPACGNEWLAGVCEKPRIKCDECNNRPLIPLSDQVIYEHLAGKRTVGVYPLLADDSCHFLAVDFDEAEWREDAKAFCQSCHELGVPVALKISRSGNGAHAWVFFSGSVSARDARRLGTAIISHTCARTRQLKLESYDRLFPNQDSMPKGGFGTRRCCGCGKNVSAVTEQWATGWQMKGVRIDAKPAPFLANPRHCPQSWKSTKRLVSHTPPFSCRDNPLRNQQVFLFLPVESKPTKPMLKA